MLSTEFANKMHKSEFFNRPAPDCDVPDFEIALHTSRPESADQTSNELVAEGYARCLVPRSVGWWYVRGPVVVNAQAIGFNPMSCPGGAVVTWVSIGIGGRIRRAMELDDEHHISSSPINEDGMGGLMFAAERIEIESVTYTSSARARLVYEPDTPD
jgi:hypothetical protein